MKGTTLIFIFKSNSFAYKSSGIFGYSMGPAGGAFATASLRPLLTELGCLPVKHSVQIPLV